MKQSVLQLRRLEILSLRLCPEGGNLILMQADSFAQRVPFQVVASGNEVLISLNVASRKEGRIHLL